MKEGYGDISPLKIESIIESTEKAQRSVESCRDAVYNIWRSCSKAKLPTPIVSQFETAWMVLRNLADKQYGRRDVNFEDLIEQLEIELDDIQNME